MATKLETLKEKGVVPQDAELSDAEKAVIEGLSDEEVKTLVSIRERLDKEIAEQGTTAIASGEAMPSSNIVI